MIAKISKGKGFRGALNYVLLKEKAGLIGGNMAGQSPRALANEFAMAQSIRGRCTKPVAHYSLSAPPGQRLTDEQWNQAARVFLTAMGFTERNQFVVARHNDRDHDHIHIIVSRVSLDRKVVSDKLDFQRSHQAARAVEKALGLPPIEQSKQRSTEQGFEQQEAGKTGLHADLRQKIDAAAQQAQGDRERFAQLMERQGVQVKFNLQTTGRISGVSFIPPDNRPVKGSALGKDYGWAAIEQKLGGQPQQPKPAPMRETVIGDLSSAKPRYTVPTGRIAINTFRGRMVVAIDRGNRIQTFTSRADAVAATIKRAQEKGWTTLNLNGSKAFRREAWIQAKLRGIEVAGYKPSLADSMKLRALQIFTRKEKHHERPDYTDTAHARRSQRAAALHQSSLAKTGRQAPAGTIAGLRNVSSVPVVSREGARNPPEMLLLANARHRLGTLFSTDPDVRRSGVIDSGNGSGERIEKQAPLAEPARKPEPQQPASPRQRRDLEAE